MVGSNTVVNRVYPEQKEGAQVEVNGGLVRIEVTLTGKTPLLMNSMSLEQLLAIRDKKKAAKSAAKPTPREEADSKLYRLADGRPHVPLKNLFAALINAGQHVRLDGKRQISTAKATVLPGMLSLESLELPIHVPGTQKSAPYEVDIQQGRNPNGGEAVCIVRPRFDQWEIVLECEIDQEQIAVSMIRDLFDIAGKRIGLGDARPARKGTFGRFVVTGWKQI